MLYSMRVTGAFFVLASVWTVAAGHRLARRHEPSLLRAGVPKEHVFDAIEAFAGAKGERTVLSKFGVAAEVEYADAPLWRDICVFRRRVLRLGLTVLAMFILGPFFEHFLLEGWSD